MFERACAKCGKSFLSRKGFNCNSAPKYCSISCANKMRRRGKRVPCAVCEEVVYRSRSKLKLSKSGLFFCSRECKGKAQMVGSGFERMLPPHYGTGFSKYRKIAFDTYLHRCADCGYDRADALVVHHKDRDKKNSSRCNLVILCRNCHYERHLDNT